MFPVALSRSIAKFTDFRILKLHKLIHVIFNVSIVHMYLSIDTFIRKIRTRLSKLGRFSYRSKQ